MRLFNGGHKNRFVIAAYQNGSSESQSGAPLLGYSKDRHSNITSCGSCKVNKRPDCDGYSASRCNNCKKFGIACIRQEPWWKKIGWKKKGKKPKK